MNKNFENNYVEEDVGELSTKYMALYGININLARAIPFVTDGLKPSFRRILYAVYKTYGKEPFVVASGVGDLLHYSPHGDRGAGDIFARLAQPFSNNIPLLDSSDGGNSGNAVNGNDAAAPRYLQMQISQFSLDVFFKEFDGKVNMIPTYDGRTVEPVTLPARVPVILLNGTSGVGYTLSSDVPPYNLNEVINATIKLMKNQTSKIRLVPDSPTGCDVIIIDDNHFVFQSSFDVDNRNYEIIIHNTPYMEYLDDINTRLCEIQDSTNPISEIVDADEESDLIAGDVKYVIRCKKCNLYQVINKLFKRVSGFRKNIATTNMKVVEPNFQIKDYDVTSILLSWINNRIREKRAWFIRCLVDKTSQYNAFKGKAFMLSDKHINKTIEMCRKGSSKEEIIKLLMDCFKGKVSSSQANLVAEVPLYKLNSKEYERTMEQLKLLEEEIVRLKAIVSDEEHIKEEIINDMNEIKKQYGFSRRSKIINLDGDNTESVSVVQILTDGSVIFSETENVEHLSSDVTPLSNDDVCLIDEHGGYIWVDTNKIHHDKPITMTSVGRGTPMGNCISAVSNRSNDIVMLSNKGRIKLMPIDRIPSNSARKPLIPLEEDEYLVSVMEVSDSSLTDILAYTNDGMGLRFQTSDLNKTLSVDANGQFIMKGQTVAGMFQLTTGKPLIAYVTKLGRVRINQAKYLTTSKKSGTPRPIIQLSAQDDLVAVCCVDKEDKLVLSHADTRVSTINVSSLPVSTMSIPPERPKHVPSVKVIRVTIK